MDNTAYVVIDLGHGDGCKGSIVDFLTRTKNISSVIRYNGGSQAGHNVVDPAGFSHVFSQIGSGSFVRDVKTILSRFMIVNPQNLINEENHLYDLGFTNSFENIVIDEQAKIVTPFHREMNRIRETVRTNTHGSVGEGIGEVMDYEINNNLALYVHDLFDYRTMKIKLEAIEELTLEKLNNVDMAEWKFDFSINSLLALYRQFVRLPIKFVSDATSYLIGSNHSVVFEGAQGVLLDEWRGFHPYTTWSTTTSENALTLLKESKWAGSIIKLGLLRSYATRHGVGPFVTEDRNLNFYEPTNGHNNWQKHFRNGYFDLVTAKYALDVNNGVDGLVISHIDKVQRKICYAYEYHGTNKTFRYFTEGTDNVINSIRVNPAKEDLYYQEELTKILNECTPIYEDITPDKFISTIESELRTPVVITSDGPTYKDKIYRTEI